MINPAADRNKEPIAKKLKQLLKHDSKVFEIGSGTGQHAAYFTQYLNVSWQPSEMQSALQSLTSYLETQTNANLNPPILFDATHHQIPYDIYNVVYTSNTFHIMSWSTVTRTLHQASQALAPGGLLIVYGPFKQQGRYNSENDEMFDQQLRKNHPEQGIRDIESVEQQAQDHHLHLTQKIAMPANNFLLVFTRL